MRRRILFGLAILWLVVTHQMPSPATEETVAGPPEIKVAACDDFEISGQGNAAAWNKVEWVPLNRRPGGALEYSARFKLLYSSTGIYVLFDGTDRLLTATLEQDFADLWNEDVYECFFWTDERHPVYFEYEISPLGYELPILVPKLEGQFLGWRPWHYEGERKVKKRIVVRDGEQKSLSSVSGWTAEVFIPFALLKPLQTVPPRPGDTWRANFYRVDHDGGKTTAWDWARVGRSFHEIEKFGTLVFE
jgi:hypothetical protein